MPVNQGNDGEIYYGDEDVDDVDDEGPVEEAVEPKIRVDWNKASNLTTQAGTSIMTRRLTMSLETLAMQTHCGDQYRGNLFKMSIDAEIEVKFVNMVVRHSTRGGACRATA